jgi:hypothetical protein
MRSFLSRRRLLVTAAAGRSVAATPLRAQSLSKLGCPSNPSTFASGRGVFPTEATWLEAELFAFPNSRHDDQVDRISQALAYEISQHAWDEKGIAGLGRFTGGLGFRKLYGL